MAISGKALSNNLIADLINNLQNSNMFTNVQLKSTTAEGRPASISSNSASVCVFVRPA